MYKKLVLVFIGLLILGIGLSATAESKAFSWTSTVTIPAVLKVIPTDKALLLELTPGSTAIAATSVSVGTNDWPLEFFLGLLSQTGETKPVIKLAYNFEVDARVSLTRTWLEILPFTTTAFPAAVLSSPGWTTYRLSIQVTGSTETTPGDYLYTLRLSFRSQSGRLETCDLPIHVTVR